MATVRKGAPAVKAVNPIQKTVSRGVIETGEKARAARQARGHSVPKQLAPNGNKLGTQVGGQTPVNGASV